MDRVSKHLGEPWRDRKYADMKIVCEGHEFAVHRVIVCTESAVLDAQFEKLFEAQKEFKEFANVTEVTISINRFDASTTGRMLQFIYEGEYSAGGSHIGAIGRLSRKDSKTEETGSSHSTMVKAQDTTEASSQALVLLDERQATSSEPAVAHILVYAIAMHFDLPALQDTALKRFEVRLGAIKAEDFSEIARVVYKNTSDNEDALRDRFLLASVKRADELTACDAFIAAVAIDPQLQPLVAYLLSAAVSASKRNLERSKQSSMTCDAYREVFKRHETELEELKVMSGSYKNEAQLLKMMYGEQENQLRCALSLAMNLGENAQAAAAQPAPAPMQPQSAQVVAQPVRSQRKENLWLKAESLKKNFSSVARQLDAAKKENDKRYNAQLDARALVRRGTGCRCSYNPARLESDDRASDYGTMMLVCNNCGKKQYGPREDEDVL
ncbi:hypothetical protein LTR17_015256 [Elasticomyces elasticus]|nr:hypothetical protein LTR17_015256 [Elasticomyces elasticus]